MISCSGGGPVGPLAVTSSDPLPPCLGRVKRRCWIFGSRRGGEGGEPSRGEHDGQRMTAVGGFPVTSVSWAGQGGRRLEVLVVRCGSETRLLRSGHCRGPLCRGLWVSTPSQGPGRSGGTDVLETQHPLARPCLALLGREKVGDAGGLVFRGLKKDHGRAACAGRDGRGASRPSPDSSAGGRTSGFVSSPRPPRTILFLGLLEDELSGLRHSMPCSAARKMTEQGLSDTLSD